MKYTEKNIRGFTIIEIAVVMIVAGSLLAFLGSSLLDFQQKRRISLTEYRLERIKSSIGVYLTKRHKLPCPAAMNVAPGSVDFGRERGSVGTPAAPPVSPDCRGGGPTFAGTQTRVGASGTANAVRFGFVPVRDLDLADDMLVDGWGNPFIYAVTASQATLDSTVSPAALYTPNGGDIGIVGVGGANVLVVPNSAHYVVLSYGADRQGARQVTGAGIPIPCINTVANVQRENCITQVAVDNNSIFMDTMHRDDGSYDDFIVYEQQQAANDDIPTGAVVPFNLRNCPLGWSALEEAHGRLVMGVVDNTFTVPNQNVDRFLYDPFRLGTINLSSNTGNITITSTETVFAASDVGRTIVARDETASPAPPYGRALITGYLSPTQVSASVTTNFTRPPTVVSGYASPFKYSVWRMDGGSNNDYITGQVTDASAALIADGFVSDPMSPTDRARHNIPPYVSLLYCVKN